MTKHVCCPLCRDMFGRPRDAVAGGWWASRTFWQWLTLQPRKWQTCPRCHGSGEIEIKTKEDTDDNTGEIQR